MNPGDPMMTDDIIAESARARSDNERLTREKNELEARCTKLEKHAAKTEDEWRQAHMVLWAVLKKASDGACSVDLSTVPDDWLIDTMSDIGTPDHPVNPGRYLRVIATTKAEQKSDP